MVAEKRIFKQKTKEKSDYINEVEAINYQTAVEAKKILNTIHRTTDKTSSMLYEQREQLEEIARESETVEDNLEKGKQLSIKMKRAGKIIVIGDKISDKIKGFFKSSSKLKKTYEPSASPPPEHTEAQDTLPAIEAEPTEESTNDVLLSIRNGLKSLKSKLTDQNKEIKNQLPLIKDITDTNTKSASDAVKVMKNLKKI
ncbi:hypothetical protein NEMIN01_1621 [Nematocida minor]|uniref:uncharacterized protein n=1 Tax=Nematocida minor TaxID=1912983 RepID=UPI002220948D|nr:uncharacterized protein NEMIN01_1621 [Nematocida minor]KAI5191688.1 hypothetical protein NEMIN01_1621 [Nematocida minor]